MDITTPEAARAFVTEKIPGAALPPGSIEAATVERRRVALSEEKNPLAVLAGRDILSDSATNTVNTERFGTRGDRGRINLTAEQRRDRNRANTECERLSQIVRGENLRVLANTPEITSIFESLISQNPTIYAQYMALGPGEQTLFRERYLGDKRVRNDIANVLKEKVRVEGIGDDELSEKRANHDRLTEEQQKLNAERDDLIRNRTAAERELHAYETSIDRHGNVTPGNYARELANAETIISDNTAKIAVFTESITSARQRIESLTSNRGILRRSRSSFDVAIDTAFQSEIDTLEGQIIGYTTERSTAQKQLANASTTKDSIEARKTSLTKTITDSTVRLREIDQRLNGHEGNEGLVIELRNARSELNKALSNKNLENQKYMSELQAILPNTLAKIIQIDIEGVAGAEKLELEKRKLDAKTELERNLLESIKERYINGDVTDWANFETDYPIFMGSGVDPIITALLPAGTTLDQFRTSNPDEYEKITKDLTKTLLRLRFSQPREGGRLRQLLGPRPISKGEIDVLITRIDEAGFEEAMKNNEAVRKIYERADKGKVLDIDGKVSEKLKKLPIGSILLALAALLGIGIFKGIGT